MSFFDWNKPTGQNIPLWQQWGFGSPGAARNDAEARRRRGMQTTSPMQSGFMGQMFGRRQDWQDPWRKGVVSEQRSAGYGQRSTGIPQETAYDQFRRTHGNPLLGGSGALGPSGLTSGQVTQMGGQRQYQGRLAEWKAAAGKAMGGGPNQFAEWLRANPMPQAATSGGGGAGGAFGAAATPAFGTPATPEALRMRDELDVIPRWLQDQFGDISQYGMYGSEGMRTIDQPMFRQEESVLGSIDPFMERMTGLYGEQTRSALDRIRDEGAQRRRRATTAAGRSLGRIAGQRPGLATQMMAEAAAPVTAAQAGMEFEAEQRGTGLEQNLLGSAYDMANQILLGRGERRTGLERENIASKSQVGLPGVAGANQYMADLLGNRYWDLENPMQSQYSYQTGLMGVGQGMDLQKMAIRQRYQSMNAEQQQKFRLELAQFQHDLGADDRSWGSFMDFLGIGAQIAGTIWGGPAGGAAATALTEKLPE